MILIISEQLLILKSFLFVVIFHADVMSSIAAWKSVKTIIEQSNSIVSIIDKMVSNSALVDDSQLVTDSTYLISLESVSSHPKPILTLSKSFASFNKLSEYIINLLSIEVPKL